MTTLTMTTPSTIWTTCTGTMTTSTVTQLVGEEYLVEGEEVEVEQELLELGKLTPTLSLGFWDRIEELKFLFEKYQPSSAGGTSSPPATPHFLQCCRGYLKLPLIKTSHP